MYTYTEHCIIQLLWHLINNYKANMDAKHRILSRNVHSGGMLVRDKCALGSGLGSSTSIQAHQIIVSVYGRQEAWHAKLQII